MGYRKAQPSSQGWAITTGKIMSAKDAPTDTTAAHGGKRPGSGRRRKTAPEKAATKPTHSVRCTDDGWQWLKEQAERAGYASVGAWADGMITP